MKVLLRRGNTATSALQVLDVPVLRLGRDAGQDVMLTDLRVALRHAEISPRKSVFGTALRLEAKSKLGVWLNGAKVTAADVHPGDVLELGGTRLTVTRGGGGFDFGLTLVPAPSAQEDRAARRNALRTSLRDAGWSRRRLSWLLFAVVLLAGLALPLVHHAESRAAPADRTLVAAAAPKADIVWNSGPLSSAHHRLAADCAACHQAPFVPVGDASCTGCHADLPTHAASARIASLAPFAQQECTDCHREHDGDAGLMPTHASDCTSCHAEPQALPGRPLLAVRSFSRDHPAFRLRLARRADGDAKHGAFQWIEARQGTTDALREDTGFVFPHDLHLAGAGIDAPEGKRTLACESCHAPTPDGAHFQPVTMAAHCADCHRLDFDPQAPERTLPHGNPAQAVAVVRDFYARRALAGGVGDAGAPAVVRSRRRPGESLSPSGVRAALGWADARANVALRDVFERRTCLICHAVTTTPADREAPWQIAPVAPQGIAWQASDFPHQRHLTERCESCHAAGTSKVSTDVLLPGIARCRDCHGDTGAMTETPSACGSCHDYHQHALTAGAKPAADPAAKPVVTRPVAVRPKVAALPKPSPERPTAAATASRARP